jgi:uncharacterized Zn finger protein
MKIDLCSYLSEFTLRRLAGSQNYKRGTEYFQDSRVRSLTEKNGGITAAVQGTEKYRVQIKVDKISTDLEFSCSCPAGLEGRFCQHLVAAGLQWLARQQGGGARHAGRKKAETLSVPEWLARQKKTVLVDFILEHADDDDDFWNWLEMQSSVREDGTLDMERLKKGLDNAVLIDDFVDYHEAYDYFLRTEKAIEILSRLLDNGHAAQVIDLSEHALSNLEQALNSMDDSSGYMQDIVSELMDLHRSACRKTRPDRKALARRLFEYELNSDHDLFSGAAESYGDILDKEGLAEYRRLAEKAWTAVKPLDPGDKTLFDAYRYRLRGIMETLARREGDIDVLADIKKRDLTRPACFLEIAQLYLDGGRDDEAIAWAERGVRAFEKDPDMRLIDFLAEAYHRKGLSDKAMELIWASFARSPGIDRYHSLRGNAKRARQWPYWRDQAIAVIRGTLAQKKESMNRSKGPMRLYNRLDHSLLVQIFLEEDDVEAAWGEAKAGGCSEALWMQLAIRREKAHPEDSLSIYQQQIEPVINRKNNDAYHEAMKLLSKIRDLMVRLGREHEFESYLHALNSEHNRKRNFMKLLEKKHWI